jgi:hypothetical protein
MIVVAWFGIRAATALNAATAREPWHVTAQPQLERLLEQATVLQTEPLGAPARGVQIWERWFAPNPDGK